MDDENGIENEIDLWRKLSNKVNKMILMEALEYPEIDPEWNAEALPQPPF